MCPRRINNSGNNLRQVTMEKDVLEEQLKCKEVELKYSKAKEEELQQQLASKERDIKLSDLQGCWSASFLGACGVLEIEGF